MDPYDLHDDDTYTPDDLDIDGTPVCIECRDVSVTFFGGTCLRCRLSMQVDTTPERAPLWDVLVWE